MNFCASVAIEENAATGNGTRTYLPSAPRKSASPWTAVATLLHRTDRTLDPRLKVSSIWITKFDGLGPSTSRLGWQR